MSDLDYARLKVLVIDDQSFIRHIIVNLLKQIGFEQIEEANDGASGLKANRQFSPDLIICDIEMEPVDGLVFLQNLRQSKDVKNPDVPFVFLTQHTECAIVEKARQLKVDAFVVKPPSFDKLKNRVDFALNHNKN